MLSNNAHNLKVIPSNTKVQHITCTEIKTQLAPYWQHESYTTCTLLSVGASSNWKRIYSNSFWDNVALILIPIGTNQNRHHTSNRWLQTNFNSNGFSFISTGDSISIDLLSWHGIQTMWSHPQIDTNHHARAQNASITSIHTSRRWGRTGIPATSDE